MPEEKIPGSVNRLIHEQSPYLQQHAHNPVDWYPWGEEALERARQEGKPILISIGYAACHWCHVMEKESFEKEETAAIMNKYFINIKIDREERPDLDHIYMDAVQAMTGSGGWPLNVFLTPDTKPFYGGTYFPPQKAFNRPSWQEVLLGVAQAFTERKQEIETQAENLTRHLLQSNSFGLKTGDTGEAIFTKEAVDEIFRNIMKTADRQWGGFGKAPKFPQTFVIKFLLRYHHETGNREALEQALLSLDKMMAGGIYDQVGGGFARYSTDSEWLAPHFEKMLYDNALLIQVLAEAFQLTQKEIYKQVLDETITFIKRELLDRENGFYSALDADSEGHEGRFYTWSKEEAGLLLGPDAALFCRYFDISEEGNWEGQNILWQRYPVDSFCENNGLSQKQLLDILSRGKEILLKARDKRIRPLTDDKIILSWNALMNTALSKAYAATGEKSYCELAKANMKFLLREFLNPGQGYHHTFKKGKARYPAFLDDYAFLVEALIHLQEVTGDIQYLEEGRQVTEFVLTAFADKDTGFFYYTNESQQDVLLRKKEVYDGALPSGNSVMAANLYKLSLYYNSPEWREKSQSAVKSLGRAIKNHPVSFGNWGCLFQEMVFGTKELAILGKDYSEIHDALLNYYLPHKILMCSHTSNNQFPLLSDKKPGERTRIYLCQNYACQLPVSSVNELKAIL